MASSKSSSGGWSAFAKTVLIPMAVALLLYLLIFQAIIPLYRKYRSNIARYSSYAPLDSSLARHTTSLFDPIIEPSRGLWERTRTAVRTTLWRWAVSGLGTANLNDIGSRAGHRRNASLDDEDFSGAEEMDDELFSIDHGRRDERGFERVDTDQQGQHRGPGEQGGSMRRLSRELEEGFRDDSESEDELAQGVTVGRSRSRSRHA